MLLRSATNPGGWDIDRLLKTVRLEVEAGIVAAQTASAVDELTALEQKHLVAALLIAETLAEMHALRRRRRPPPGRLSAAARHLELVT